MKTILKTILFCCIICLCYACDKHEEDILNTEEAEEYQLLFSYGDRRTDQFLRRHLIDYFQQVALGSEYGSNFPLVKKWKHPMRVYVSGNADRELIIELNAIIEELNALFTDGFQIEMASDSVASNYHIFLGDVATYGRMYPSIAHLLKENSGLFVFYHNTDFNITSGHMFVDIYNNSLTYQKHILREELTQSLGLPNDIKYYPNSIFYEQRSDVQAYSNLDIEVIRLLYHPKMVSKIGASTVQSILEGILGL